MIQSHSQYRKAKMNYFAQILKKKSHFVLAKSI